MRKLACHIFRTQINADTRRFITAGQYNHISHQSEPQITADDTDDADKYKSALICVRLRLSASEKWQNSFRNWDSHNCCVTKLFSDGFLQRKVITMKKCPFCKHGILEQKTVKETYTYKGCSAEFEQPGEWCDSCGEGILSSADLMATEMHIKDFQAKVDGLLSSDENWHIHKKLKLTA